MSFAFIFIFLLSASIISSHKDAQGEKISFGDWLKGLWGKITGQQTLQLQRGDQLCKMTDGDGDSYILNQFGACPALAYDCNDNNANIKPGAAEICGNNLDEDCSGADLACPPSTCVNDCTPSGSKQCAGTGGYKTCGNYDVDSCLEWSTATLCSIGQTCSNGVCAVSSNLCTDVDGDNYGTGNLASCLGSTTIADCNDADATIKPGSLDPCKDCNALTLCNIPSCVSTWTRIESACNLNEAYTIYYLNQTDCIDSRPANETSSCDYNKNNLVCESFPGIESVGIGGYLLNISKNYTDTGINLVQLAQTGFGGVDFNWNFADPLNFCNISVEVAESSNDFGYTIVKNVNAKNKTIWVERLNNSNKVCVKDIPGEISIGDFSSKCNENDEVLVFCPSGINSTYNCIIDYDTPPSRLSWFKVWPLNHSAVKEMPSLITGSLLVGNVCQENWNCTNWTDVNDIGEGCGAGICEDLEDCGTAFNKPLEIKSCISEGECTPSWTCTGFGKCIDGFKERICTDSEDCGVDTNKPSEISECKKGKSPFLIIILAIVGLILIIFLIIYFMKRKSSEEEEPSENQYPASPPSPPRPPANVYTPRPQYAQPYIQR